MGGIEIWQLLRVMASLVVVVVLIVISLRFALPLLQRMQSKAMAEKRIQVAEITPLDRTTRLALVKVEGREYFLALTAERVTSIDSWTQETPEPEEEITS